MILTCFQSDLEDEESILEVLRPKLVRHPGAVVVLTERMAHDLLSNGIVPCCLSCHKAVVAGNEEISVLNRRIIYK